MIAGSLGRLVEPVDDPLESWYRGGGSLPALDVKTTQASFDDRPIQSGLVASTTTREPEIPSVGVDMQGNPVAIVTEQEEVTEHLLTEFVADVTGTGLVVAESTDGNSPMSFPFDMFWSRTETEIQRLEVDVAEMHTAWSQDDALGEVWMTGADAGDGASIDYHSRADADATPTIGLGFTRPWSGTVMDGVVYESGYLAVYNSNVAEEFIRFVEEELLEFAYVPGESEEQGQATLGESTGDSDEESDECERCGRDVDHVVDGKCAVCRDKESEEAEEFANLETVNMTDGVEDDGE